MINVRIYYNTSKDICGFTADDHGDPMVCAAVSAIVLNTINSVESFTDVKFYIDYNEKGGFVAFRLADTQKSDHDTQLLLRSMLLGLKDIEAEYSKHIQIEEEAI